MARRVPRAARWAAATVMLMAMTIFVWVCVPLAEDLDEIYPLAPQCNESRSRMCALLFQQQLSVLSVMYSVEAPMEAFQSRCDGVLVVGVKPRGPPQVLSHCGSATQTCHPSRFNHKENEIETSGSRTTTPYILSTDPRETTAWRHAVPLKIPMRLECLLH